MFYYVSVGRERGKLDRVRDGVMGEAVDIDDESSESAGVQSKSLQSVYL